MKLKLSELNANPFKKEINKGKLDEDTIKKIQANIKELGLMGALPVFKKDNKYFLVAGHHRVEALRREFGKDFEINVDLHNYSEDQVLRGMVVENLTQRSNDAQEIMQNLSAIRKHLRLSVHPMDKKASTGGRPEGTLEQGSVRHISQWLDKGTGDVMKHSSIQDYLSMMENLSPNLVKKVRNTHGMTDENKDVSIAKRVGKEIAKIKDHKTQEAIVEKLAETNYDAIRKEKLVLDFARSPKKVQERVLNDEISLEDVPVERMQEEIKEIDKEKDEEKKKKLIVTTYEKYKRQVEGSLGKVGGEIESSLALLAGLQHSKVLEELDINEQIPRLVRKKAEAYIKILEKIWS